MNKVQNKIQKPNHEGNIITHSRKWQELELQRWKVTSRVLQQVNHVSVEEVEAQPDAIIGKFLVKTFTAIVLF